MAKRFTEVDSDSEGEVRYTPKKKPLPTLSFRTEQTTSIRKDDDSSAGSATSIQFDCETDLCHSSNGPQPKSSKENGTTSLTAKNTLTDGRTPPPLQPAPLVDAPSPKAHISQRETNRRPALPKDKALVTAGGLSSIAPVKQRSSANNSDTRGGASVTVRQALGHDVSSTEAPPGDESNGHLKKDASDSDGDTYAQEVLPLSSIPSRHLASAAGTVPRPRYADPPAPTPLNDLSSDILVRAQIRLQQKVLAERSVVNSMPHSRKPSPHISNTPVRRQRHTSLAPSPAKYREASEFSSPHFAATASPQVEARVQRLNQENRRLQDEVAFLDRENQKLRCATGANDAAENVRLQLMIDVMRKEIHDREARHQLTLNTLHTERSDLQAQLHELVDQCESYSSSAAQYHRLYEDKLKEVEGMKLQFQRLVDDVNSLESKERVERSQHQQSIVAERERSERMTGLLDDLKRQRDHLQLLNAQLLKEKNIAVEEKARAKEASRATEENYTRCEERHKREILSLQQDLEKLRGSLAEKERLHATQLQEVQHDRSLLQKRVHELSNEMGDEMERLRRCLEVAKEDAVRAVRDEKALCEEAKERVRREEIGNRALAEKQAEKTRLDLEHQLRSCQGELRKERDTKDRLQREVNKLVEKCDTMAESACHFQKECQTLSAHLALAEQLRDKADGRCAELSATLSEMMAHEEIQSRTIEELQLAFKEANQMPGDTHCSGGEGVALEARQLAEENERLTEECTRLARERDALIDENGHIAEELLKWKHEMRQFVAAQVHTSPRKQYGSF